MLVNIEDFYDNQRISMAGWLNGTLRLSFIANSFSQKLSSDPQDLI